MEMMKKENSMNMMDTILEMNLDEPLDTRNPRALEAASSRAVVRYRRDIDRLIFQIGPEIDPVKAKDPVKKDPEERKDIVLPPLLEN
jgi:hypothetical protein